MLAVSSAVPGGPADRAGLQPGDVLVGPTFSVSYSDGFWRVALVGCVSPRRSRWRADE